MLVLNNTKYKEAFSVRMSYADTKKVFGMIPFGEYLLMLGMETYRAQSGDTKEAVMASLYAYAEPKDAPVVDPHIEVSRGLGDTVAKITSAVGISPCGGCKQRQEKLNKWFPYE